SVRARIAKALHEPAEELLPAVEQPLEGHRRGDYAVIEEKGDAFAGGELLLIGPRRVDGAGNFGPGFLAAFAPAPRLTRGQHREADPRGGKGLQRRRIDCGFSKPHPFGRPAETVLEVGDAPEHL